MYKNWACHLALLAALSCGLEVKAESPKNLFYEMELDFSDRSNSAPSTDAQKLWDKLLEDISVYRYTVTDMSNEQAAKEWWALTERAFKIVEQSDGDVKSRLHGYEKGMGYRPPITEISQALPPSRAWMEIEKVLENSKSEVVDDYIRLLLRIQIAAVRQDFPKCQKLIEETRTTLIGNKEFQCSYLEDALEILDEMELEFRTTFGSVEERIKLFEEALDRQAKAFQEDEDTESLYWLPEVEQLDEVKAKALMRKYLSYNGSFDTRSSSAVLARKVLLESPEIMTDSHWKYADPEVAPELYEKMSLELPLSHPVNSVRLGKDLQYVSLLFKQQKYEEAQERLDEWIATYGIRGVDTIYFPAHEGSLEILKRNLERNPTLPWWHHYGSVARQLGQGQEAEAYLKATLEKGGLAARLKQPIQVAYISHLIALAKYDEAIELMRQISSGPSSAAAAQMQFRLSKFGRLTGNKEMELEGLTPFLRSAERLGPQTTDLVTLSLLRNNRADEAENLLKKVLPTYQQKLKNSELGSNRWSSQAGVSRALSCLAKVYHDTERYQEMLDLLAESEYWGGVDVESVAEVRTFPKSLRYMVGNALIQTGKTKYAINLAERLIHVQPQSNEGYDILVRCLGAEALPKLDGYFVDRPQEIRPLVWKAKVLLEKGDAAEALKVMRHALQIEPCEHLFSTKERRQDYQVLAAALKANGQEQEASKYDKLTEAMELTFKAEEWGQIQGDTQSLQLYQEALKHFDAAYEIHLGLSATAFNLGNQELGETHAKRALELLINEVSETMEIGPTQRAQLVQPKFLRLADAYLEERAKADPKDARILYLRGKIRDFQHRDSESLKFFLQAVELNPRMKSAHEEAYAKVKMDSTQEALAEELAIGLMRLEPLDARANSVRMYEVQSLAKGWDLTYELDKISPVSHRPNLMYPLKRMVENNMDFDKPGEKVLYPFQEMEGKDILLLHHTPYLRPVQSLIKCYQAMKRGQKLEEGFERRTPQDLRNRS